MDAEHPHAHKNTLKRIFITGFLVLVPIAATLALLVFLFNLFDGWLSPYGGQILRSFGVQLPAEWKRVPGTGILATILLTFLTGLISSHYLGRRLVNTLQNAIERIPLVSNIYGGIRQFLTAFSARDSKTFQTVVLVEFPKPHMYTIGFLTTASLPAAQKLAKTKLVNVFIPAAPIPSQGLFMMIPVKQVRVLPITVEEAVKMLATLGLVQKEPLSELLAKPSR
jgi:uncharacterized membrane protein